MALLVVAPLVLPEFWRRFLTEILIWGLLAMSSDHPDRLHRHDLVRPFGLLRARHVRRGGRAADWSARRISGWRSCSGSAGAAVVALFVAYFSTRLRDIYFAITTLIFSQIFYVIIFTWTEVTGGENGLTFSRPRLAIPCIYHVPLHHHDPALVRAGGGGGVLSDPAAHHPVAVRHGAAIDPRERGRAPARSAIRSSATRSSR